MTLFSVFDCTAIVAMVLTRIVVTIHVYCAGIVHGYRLAQDCVIKIDCVIVLRCHIACILVAVRLADSCVGNMVSHGSSPSATRSVKEALSGAVQDMSKFFSVPTQGKRSRQGSPQADGEQPVHQFNQQQLSFMSEAFASGLNGFAQVVDREFQRQNQRIDGHDKELKDLREEASELKTTVVSPKTGGAQGQQGQPYNPDQNGVLPPGLSSYPQPYINSYMHAAPMPPVARAVGRPADAIPNNRHFKFGNLGRGLERTETLTVIREILSRFNVNEECIASASAFEAKDGTNMAEILVSEGVNVEALFMNMRSAGIKKIEGSMKTVWGDYHKIRSGPSPQRILERAEAEIKLIEQALVNETMLRDPSFKGAPSVVSVDQSRFIVLVDKVAMGRVVNRQFIFTPSAFQKYSADHRSLAEMVVNSPS